MPRIAAASCSSRVRTLARSSPAIIVPSLTDPFSPRDAHSSTTRAPASARRAIVPPHASDSSSGCARTTRIVRPEKSGRDDALIHRFVFVDHALDAEACDGLFANAPAIERKHGCEVRGHRVEVFEDHARHAFVNHLAHRAEVDRKSTRLNSSHLVISYAVFCLK